MRYFGLGLAAGMAMLAVFWIGISAGKSAKEERPSIDPAISLPGAGGPLGHLTGLRPGRSARVSSAAPTRSSNRDNRKLEPARSWCSPTSRAPPRSSTSG